jgi:ribosomal-protein-serine acetyltransferase
MGDDAGDVLLRPYRPGDEPEVFAAIRESVEELCRWMPWCHPGYSIEETRAWIEHCGVARARGSEFHFVIEDRSGAFLGTCGLNQMRHEHRMANLGYWVRTRATGRGVATRAVRQLAEFAFRETELVRLEIVVALDNFPSMRVAEKSGAIREGIAHQRLRIHDRSEDAIVYAILRPAGLGRSASRNASPEPPPG